jgi:hypothetical protein
MIHTNGFIMFRTNPDKKSNKTDGQNHHTEDKNEGQKKANNHTTHKNERREKVSPFHS